MKVILLLTGLLGAISAHALEDRKCYVELENGEHVILQGTITDSQKPEVIFKKKGFEMDGQLSMVRRVLECQPSAQPFNLVAAQKQESQQPR
ncbi:type IVa secretion system protein TapY2 [Aeromonas finlandensis]|uniref:type IVa secretion system protein TapY2 n=1 Tax=Aeromonas finlandensis TaxID=1543375 RepID=UPI00051C2CCA|nr:type IVa secretion system protein TapY2 [Aeromonas finlandensis]